MGEAAATAVRLIERCVDHAVTELQAAAVNATQTEQRQELTAAWRELLMQRPTWATRFPQILKASFDTGARGEDAAAGAPAPIKVREAALTLVDDTEISRGIEASRLTQQLVASLDRPLAELDALMSSALGLPGVRPEKNPLRPEIYAQALRQVIDEVKPDPAWSALWVRHMTQPLTEELAQLYRDQAAWLTQARVQAAGYRVVGTPSRERPMAPANPAAGQAAQAGAAAPQPERHAQHGQPAAAPPLHAADFPVQQLQQFLARNAAATGQPPEHAYFMQAERELRALQAAGQEVPAYDAQAAQAHAHLPVVERPQRHVATDSPLPQETWGALATPLARSLVRTRLKTEVREVEQAFSLEIVRALVDLVAQDPRLLTPMREAIIALEPSLLRLAMVAPRFFSDEAHPGRLLVEGVAERSFKYNDEFSAEFERFFRPVAEGFRRLNDNATLKDAEPFRALLAGLQSAWKALDAIEDAQEREVVAAVQRAERRQLEANRIAGELQQRDDLAQAPATVHAFVVGVWALVIAHARQADGGREIDPGGYLAVVADLLWSVKRELALKDPARAFVTIPRVLLKLRAGLGVLGQEPAESAGLFLELEKLHRPVMKLRAQQRHRDLGASVQAPDEPPPATPAARPDGLWMAQQELRNAGFEDTQPGAFTLQSERDATPDHAELLTENDTEIALAELVPGCWVDLFARQQWRRARMVWATQRGTLFVFVSTGGRPHSMTRRSMQRLLRDRLLRPVAGDGVVPRALQRIAQQPASPKG